jgi:hypothetical protein
MCVPHMKGSSVKKVVKVSAAVVIIIIIIISSVQGSCIPNCMKLSISKTKVTSFSRKTTVLIYDYKLCQSSIVRTESIKDLGIYIDNKL